MTLRTWELNLPEEPTDIEGVRDRDGDLWRPGRDSGWFSCGKGRDGWSFSVDRVGVDWATILQYGPLREVTLAGERVGPIEVTEEMISAGASAAVASTASAGTYKLVRVIVEAALGAGGYEVTE